MPAAYETKEYDNMITEFIISKAFRKTLKIPALTKIRKFAMYRYSVGAPLSTKELELIRDSYIYG